MYYVVFKRRKIDFFKTWNECNKEVYQFPNAKLKK